MRLPSAEKRATSTAPLVVIFLIPVAGVTVTANVDSTNLPLELTLIVTVVLPSFFGGGPPGHPAGAGQKGYGR